MGIEDDCKLRLRCHFSYSDVQRFESLLLEWNEYIAEDIDELQKIRDYLDALTQPFGFLKVVIGQRAEELKEEDREDLQQ